MLSAVTEGRVLWLTVVGVEQLAIDAAPGGGEAPSAVGLLADSGREELPFGAT